MNFSKACALLTILVLAGCSPEYRPTAAPTVAETRAFITEVVRLAQAGEFEQLCEMGGGNCEDILATAGADNVPADPPVVARIYEVPSVRHADGSWSQGGQMVEMCGTDGSGIDYQTQMLVFRDPHEGIIAIEPIYWSGIGIIAGGEPRMVEPTDPAFAC
jgi:hypothetical protein